MPFSIVLSLALIIYTFVTTQTHPNLVLDPRNVAIFGPKILAVLKRRGKNFGGVFFDSFRQSEHESEKISALDALLTKITN
jgi:hypothetical protein